MDTIDGIIDRAIAYTDNVLTEAPEHAEVAITKLRRLRQMIVAAFPHHTSVERVSSYIENFQDRLHERLLRQ